MKELKLSKAFTFIESGPVIMVTTSDKGSDNIMTISWTMVLDFSPRFAITTGPWNYSYKALTKTKECVLCIPTVDLIEKVTYLSACLITSFKSTPITSANIGSVRRVISLSNLLKNPNCEDWQNIQPNDLEHHKTPG